MGLSHLSETPFHRGLPPPFLQVLLLGGQTSIRLGSPSSVVFCSSPTPGSLLRRTPPLPQVLALWEETLIASGICILHSRGIQTPPYWSVALPAGWQIHLPQGPALAGHVSSLSGPYNPPLSALAQRHAETSHAVLQGNGGYLPPI